MSFGLNDDVNKVQRTELKTPPKQGIKNDNRNYFKSVLNTINHSNNSNIASFTERNFGENIQRIDTKSNVGTSGDLDTGYLVEMFAISAVGGFVGLKIISSVV